MKITNEQITRLIEIIDGGLKNGGGNGKGPGDFCVQNAVCRVFDFSGSSDTPRCVSPDITNMGIAFNDHGKFGTKKKRAEALKFFAIAELGSTEIDMRKFTTEFRELCAINLVELLPPVGAGLEQLTSFIVEHGNVCQIKRAIDLAVEALRRCGSPGCKFLELAGYQQLW